MTEEFEKWFADEFGDEPARETKYWPSWNRSRDVARIAWQASRKAALDDVIACIEEHKDYRGGYVDNGIEDEIRAFQ
jgi:hypothetical protein